MSMTDLLRIRNCFRLSLQQSSTNNTSSQEPSFTRDAWSPKLYSQLERLPDGFSTLAISGKLSNELIQILSEFQDWFNSVTCPDTLSAERKGWHTVVPDGLSKFERIICIALLSLADDVLDVAVHNLWLGISAIGLPDALVEVIDSPRWPSSHDLSQAEIDTLLWCTTVIACPADRNLNSAVKGRQLLAGLQCALGGQRRGLDAEAMEKVMLSFFWEKKAAQRWNSAFRELESAP